MMKTLAVLLVLLIAVLLAETCEANRYWIVAGSTTEVYSLDDNAFVGAGNTDYTAWRASGNIATRIASSAELYDVLQSSFPLKAPAAVIPLEAHGGLTASQSLVARRNAGLQITYTGASALNGTYVIDDQWLNGLMAGALLRCGPTALAYCDYPFPNRAATYDFTDLNGSVHTMTVLQMANISLAIQDFWANCVAQMRIQMGGGTPTWPSNSVTVP